MNALCQPGSRYTALIVGLFLLAASTVRSIAASDPHPIADPSNCELHPALEISLFAKEPDVVSPVALTFDDSGRVYVVEMRDYPYGFGPDRKPGGTVRLLEDLDGDGDADRSTLFADNLSFPTSICPWNGGVLVAGPPEILFLKDTDGDGKSDLREVLIKGFTLGVTDSNMNGLRWGLDNRVHGANGGNGGRIVSTRKPGPPVSIRNLDFSFDPATGDFSPTYHTSGGFGLVIDDWGRSFGTYNIDHVQQRIIPARYLDRFPGLPPVDTTVSISDHGDMARIYPIVTAVTRPNHPEQAGHFSAAGGISYIGSAEFPDDLPGSLLVCDVVGNLVHRDLLKEGGPAFIATRSPSESKRELFASRDAAFRPVGVEPGPDDALYLIDMQRDVIEHPDYIPKKLLDHLDIRAGEDRGRIYRLTPKNWRLAKRARRSSLSRATTGELVDALASPSQWWRLTAQRLLVERRDADAVPLLRRMVSQRDAPEARLHALWTLSGLNMPDEELVMRSLMDTHPGVRENGLILAERFLPASIKLSGKILTMAGDRSARVRFQTALTLGQVAEPGVNEALRRILLTDCQYRWTRMAVLSSLRDGPEDLFQSLLTDPEFQKDPTGSKTELIRELADLVGARASSRPQGLNAVLWALTELSDQSWKVAALDGLQSGLARSGSQINGDARVTAAIEKLSADASPALLAAAWKTSRALNLPETESQAAALARAIQRAHDESLSLDRRLDEIRLLGLGSFAAVKPSLLALLSGSQPSVIQMAAVDVLAKFNDLQVAESLIDRWRGLAPAVRVPVVNLLLQRTAYHAYLIEAMETEKIRLGELNLDLEQRRRLLRASTPENRARAAKLISDEEYSNRKGLVEEWLKKLPPTGEARRGKAVYEKACAQCHAAGGIGFPVGPDLTAVSHRSVEDLASNILDPNMAINPAYTAYSCETVSGELETGILQSESAEAITLLQANARKVVIARKDIRRLDSSELSLMPEGLEAGLTPADLRDLIAFLQESR